MTTSICIVIPAYNEQDRITNTIHQYAQFFATDAAARRYEVLFLVMLNGCVDNTRAIVQKLGAQYPNVRAYEIPEAGKGLAIKIGFQHALLAEYNLIGFVDADMATIPAQFMALIQHIGDADGIIASRYMPGAKTFPERPWIKRWGSKIFYENLVGFLFGLRYHDYQCGAKLFKRTTLEALVPHLTVTQWAFDVELLYWCKRLGFWIKEFPTIWYDRTGSKLTIFGSGLPMLSALVRLRMRIWLSGRG